MEILYIYEYRLPSLFAAFLSSISLIRGPNLVLFKERILQFQHYLGLFKRSFVIHGPKFAERI